MADIVQSLFGVTPELYQQAQAQRANEQALQYAQLSPFQQANYAIGRGAYQLAGALGAPDPQLQLISTRNSIARQINYNDPNSIMQGVQQLSQAGDTVGAMQLADVARKLESEMAQRFQRAAAGQASLSQAARDQAELADIAAQRAAYQQLMGGAAPAATPAAAPAAEAPGTDRLGDFIQQQLAASENRPQYEIAAGSLPGPLAPAPVSQAQAPAPAPAAPVQTRGTLTQQIADLEKQQAALLSLPKVPAAKAQAQVLGDQIKFLRENTKQSNFTGDAANAARYLYGTTDSNEIYRNHGPAGIAAVQEKEKQIVQEKRPVTNITNPVTVNMQKGFGEDLAQTITGAFGAARTASSTLANVRNMRTLLDEGVRTGFGQEQMLALGKAGQLFNPEFNIKGLAGQEAFKSFSNSVILPEVKKLGANPTDSDLKFIVSGSPGLSTTPDGNRLMLDAIDLKLQREIDYGKFSTRWMATNSNIIKTDPITARAKLETDFETYTQSSPLYGPAANTLRDRFTALGGQTRGSEPARRALQSGGFTR